MSHLDILWFVCALFDASDSDWNVSYMQASACKGKKSAGQMKLIEHNSRLCCCAVFCVALTVFVSLSLKMCVQRTRTQSVRFLGHLLFVRGQNLVGSLAGVVFIIFVFVFVLFVDSRLCRIFKRRIVLIALDLLAQ